MKFFTLILKKLHYEFLGRNNLQPFPFIDYNFMWIKIII